MEIRVTKNSDILKLMKQRSSLTVEYPLENHLIKNDKFLHVFYQNQIKQISRMLRFKLCGEQLRNYNGN